MALIGINPARPRQEGPDTMTRIAQGLDIAKNVLGVSLAIPTFLQAKRGSELEQASKLVDIASKSKPWVPETPTEEKPRNAVEIPGLGIVVPQAESIQLDKREEKIFDTYAKNRKIVPEPTKNAIKVSLGGEDYYFEEDEKDTTDKRDTKTEARRKEFLKQSETFQSVSDSYVTLLSLAKKPSAAGDIAIVQQYMRMVDPGSRVTGQEQATAQNAAGVSESVRNWYNRLLSGMRLGEEGSPTREDFLNQAMAMYEASLLGHKKRENTYRKLASHEKLDPDYVVPDITPEIESLRTPSVETKIVNGKTYKKVPGGWNEVK